MRKTDPVQETAFRMNTEFHLEFTVDHKTQSQTEKLNTQNMLTREIQSQRNRDFYFYYCHSFRPNTTFNILCSRVTYYYYYFGTVFGIGIHEKETWGYREINLESVRRRRLYKAGTSRGEGSSVVVRDGTERRIRVWLIKERNSQIRISVWTWTELKGNLVF